MTDRTGIMRELNIIDNENLCKIIVKGLKSREPQFINWKYNKLLMDKHTIVAGLLNQLIGFQLFPLNIKISSGETDVYSSVQHVIIRNRLQKRKKTTKNK